MVCYPNLCKNGGICKYGSCYCISGFIGRLCETVKEDSTVAPTSDPAKTAAEQTAKSESTTETAEDYLQIIIHRVWTSQRNMDSSRHGISPRLFLSAVFLSAVSLSVFLSVNFVNLFLSVFLSKMENVHLFLELTPTLWQMPRDVTNIPEDLADFCQCQEFWCHFLSFVF